MHRGFIAVWRQAGFEDLQLDPHAYKLWMCLNLLAQHSKWRDLAPGDLQTTYTELQEHLRDSNGKTYSRHTVQSCLSTLAGLGYIEILEAHVGKRLTVRIFDWGKQQGPKPKGYNYARYDYPPAASAD